LGVYYAEDLNGYGGTIKVNLDEGCELENVKNCLYTQLIYRASFSTFILFCFISLTTYFSEYINKSFWILKLSFSIGFFVALWWASNDFFSGFAEFCRVISFFWLVAQSLLMLDFAHDIHDIIMARADEAEHERGEQSAYIWYIIYLLASISMLTLAGVGLAYICIDYIGCSDGVLFLSITIIAGVLTIFASLLNVINKGLLTPCIMFAYTTLICWYIHF
jgi:hypothetical protein